jgi:hypothetical protein
MDKHPEHPCVDERSLGGTSPGPGRGSAAASTTTQAGGEGGVVGRSDHILAFDGLLFDMDGTLVDSTKAIVKHWQK